MPEAVHTVAGRIGPIVDSNVHLWEQPRNPVFWLEDRTNGASPSATELVEFADRGHSLTIDHGWRSSPTPRCGGSSTRASPR